jgi:hypothetical protein
MKPRNLNAAIGLALVGVVFLVPTMIRVINNGEPLSLTPGVAAAIGLFLGAVVNLVLWRMSGGHSGSPTA